jgi:23S rRNA U2552 (ribose-2'-O)-methylase RlmE/FtsJ
MLQFSDEAARKLEAIYSSADVVAQRRAMLDRLSLRPGESVIDIGCGPGFLCEEMAVAVAETGTVVGVDEPGTYSHGLVDLILEYLVARETVPTPGTRWVGRRTSHMERRRALFLQRRRGD